MKKKSLIVFVILLLVAIDLVFIILCTSLNKNLHLVEYKYKLFLKQDSLKAKMYIENILQYTINTREKVKENLELISENGQKTTLQRLVIKRPVIFFKYFQESCNSCVESEFRIMREIFSTEELQNIIVLTTDKDPINISQFKDMNRIKNPVYIIKNTYSDLPVDKLGIPYMFVLNDSLYIENLFIPLKLISAPSVAYYKYIKCQYFECCE
jgi:hypothetical protein